MKKNKVLFVGWDAADWKIIDRLMENGLMPAMKRIVDNGVRGQLATLDPPLSPMLWTSMATGVRPFEHGVLGFVEHDGDGGVRPVSSHSRKVNAIWNMLTKEGYKSNIVGWWPSNPVESINGCMVSNLFQQEKKGREVMDMDEWELPEGSVYPESLTERLMELRIHPQMITGNLVMPFVPQAHVLDKKKDKRLTVIQKFIAHSTTLHAVFTELMETEEWDFSAIYLDAIDHFSHAFMRFHPPQMEGTPDEEYNLFKDVVTGAYVFHDMMLERLLNLIDDETTIIVASDHGFHSDHLRPRFVPNVPSGPAIEHAPFGIFAAMGPGIKKGERVFGASVLDITPTLLTLFDLPIGRNMHGKPLMDIYKEPKEIKFIDSWDKVDKEGGEIVVTSKNNSSAGESALQQLIDLGYIDDMKVDGDPEGDRAGYLKNVIAENNFYLAKSYINAGYNDEGLEILLELEKRDKPDFRMLLEIVGIAIKTQRYKLAEEYINFIRTTKIMSENYVNLLEAKVQIGLSNPAKAFQLFDEVEKNSPESIEVLLEFGRLLNMMGKYERAFTMFKRVTELDPANAYAYNGMGVAALRTEKYEDALTHFLDAIERIYHYPFAHFNLGETLALMKEYESAIQAFHVVEAIAPQMPKTYRWLWDLYDIVGNTSMAARYGQIVKRNEVGEKIIITGVYGALLEDLIASLKKADVTIGGNTEDILGSVTSVLTKDWFTKIEESVVYVPLSQIQSLPVKYSYRILFAIEDSEEVMRFLQSKARSGKDAYNEELFNAIDETKQKVLTWLAQQPNIDILYLNEKQEINSELVKHFVNKI